MGEKETCWPRSRGRSGCVITPKTLKSDCARRSLSVGTANCGVPQKSIRISFPLRPPGGRLRRLPLSLFPELLDLALDEIAFQHAEVLEKKDSIEVIDFMAKGACQKVFAANFKELALGVLCFDGHKLRPQHISAEARNGQA